MGDPPKPVKVIWSFFENLNHLTLIGMSYENKSKLLLLVVPPRAIFIRLNEIGKVCMEMNVPL